MQIFILTLKITDFHIQCTFSLAFPWGHNPLLFCVNLINELLPLSFCTQNFYSISTTILFTQDLRVEHWKYLTITEYWIISLHIKLQMWSESQFPDYLGWVVLITSKPRVQPRSAKPMLDFSNVRWALPIKWSSPVECCKVTHGYINDSLWK